MLDEILEHKQYINIGKEKKGEEPRLIPLLFRGKISTDSLPKSQGIRRSLTILARYYLYQENNYDKIHDAKELAEIRKNAKEYLYDWCFGDKYLKKYYIKYYESLMVGKPTKEDVKPTKEDVLVKWNKFAKSKFLWNTENIYRPLHYEKSSLNAINFNIIIAEAIHKGPLKRKYLLIKEGFNEKLYYVSDTESTDVDNFEETNVKDENLENTESTNNKLKKLSKGKTGLTNQDRCLKIIAAYLLQDENDKHMVTLTNVDVANWMSFPSFFNNNKRLKYYYKNLDLFEEKNGAIHLNSDFFETYNPKLVDVNGFKKSNYKGYYVYADTGNTPLKQK